MKDEADLPVADFGELQVVELAEVFAIEQHRAARGPVQRADDLQQGALAGAGRADDGDSFAARDFERHGAEHTYASGVTGARIAFGYVGKF